MAKEVRRRRANVLTAGRAATAGMAVENTIGGQAVGTLSPEPGHRGSSR
ncbi:hypothetical protein [Desulfosarcina alkanivorans]|nr:hypothetical protein [Desulfosarcina alkanivorans]